MNISKLAAILICAAATAPAQAQVASAPPIVPPTGLVTSAAADEQLGCEALSAEMDVLSSRIQAAAGRMQTRADSMTTKMQEAGQRQQPNTAMLAAGVAASFIPGAGLLLGAAQSLAAASAPPPSAPDLDMSGALADAQAMQDLVPVGARFERLQSLWLRRQCG